MTNCKNCGAPLRGPVCEYCGTNYSREPEFQNCGDFGCSFEQMSKAAQDFAKAIGSPWETHYEGSNLVTIYKQPDHNFFIAESFAQFPKIAETKAGDYLLWRDYSGIDRLCVFDGIDWQIVE